MGLQPTGSQRVRHYLATNTIIRNMEKDKTKNWYGKLTSAIQEGSKRERSQASSQSPSCWTLSWLRDVCATRKDPESDYGPSKITDQDNPEINCIIIKPETVSHVVEKFTQAPLPCHSLPGSPSQ